METITDQLNYIDEIKKALPKAQIKIVNNFDDMNFGYEISPRPGELIVFKIDMNDQMQIKINWYSIQYHHEPRLNYRQLFMGIIPANERMEPDFDFIRQLIKNYNCIG